MFILQIDQTDPRQKPAYYVHKLRACNMLDWESIADLGETMKYLRVALTSNSVSWVKGFGPSGLTLLLDKLRTVSAEYVEYLEI